MRLVSNEDALIADIVRRQAGVSIERTEDRDGNQSLAIEFDALTLHSIPKVQDVRVKMGVGRGEFRPTHATVE